MKKKTIKWIAFALLLCSLFSCNKDKPVFFFGNFEKEWITLFQRETQLSTNSAFTSIMMTSNEMYKIADTRSFAIQNGKKYMFEKQVQKSKMIILSIGFQDIKPYLTIDPEHHNFSYDEAMVEKQKELLVYNVFHVVEELRLIRATTPIYLLGIWKNFNLEAPEEKLLNSFLNEMNLALQEAIHEQNVTYIPLSQVKTNEESIQEVKRYIL